MAPCYIFEDYLNDDVFRIVDQFYAHSLVYVAGFFEHVRDNGNFPMNGMTSEKCYHLIDRIRSYEHSDLIDGLRDLYNSTGFLIFVDDTRKVIVYSEDIDSYLNFIRNGVQDGPSSSEIYENFNLN